MELAGLNITRDWSILRRGPGAERFRLIGVVISVALLGFVQPGCSQDPGETGDRCPPGLSYDADLDRCIDEDADANGSLDAGTTDADEGDNGSNNQTNTDDAGGLDADASSGDTEDAGGGNDGSDTGSTGEDAGQDGGGDTGDDDVIPGGCGGDSMADDFAVVTVPETSFGGRVHAAPAPDDGVFIAWREDQQIQVAQTEADGSLVETHTFEGADIYGLAASDDKFALLIFRQTDILALVVAEHDGTVLEDSILIGDVDHSVEGNEWFGSQIRDGRLTEADGQWAAYYTVQRLWDDGVAHYGDQLRNFEADGSPANTRWDWGCSHSMEVRISHNGDRLGPLCSSDCYPTKGVHYDHKSGELWSDQEGSNCAGGYGTTLGGSIPVDGGFWMVFTATDERDSHDVAINRVSGYSASSDDTLWLTENDVDAQNLSAEMYGPDHLLVAWTTGATWSDDGTTHFTLVDEPDGDTVSGPEEIPEASLPDASAFFRYTNGDIGWVQPSEDNDIDLARLHVCP